MKPLPERLNDQLERRNARSWNDEQPSGWSLSPVHAPDGDPEVDELVTLALRLQAAPPLQVDPNFARQLEQRMQMHNAALHSERAEHDWSFPRLLHAHPIFGVALGLCLFLLLLGTGLLVAGTQVSNPSNPLYAVMRWEQHVQIALVSSPESQAELELQFARDRLNTLANLAGSAHAEAYRQALVDLDEQINTAARMINALPAGSYHNRLVSELAAFEADASHTLRSLLPQLALPERLVTTGELGRLGDNVPRLVSVEIVLTVHPKEHAIISITGDNIQPGAQLLVDNRLVEVRSSFQNSLYVFMTNWVGNQHPQSIGILNPDGSAAQTTAITLTVSDDHGNSNGNNNHGEGGNGNENGRGKP